MVVSTQRLDASSFANNATGQRGMVRIYAMTEGGSVVYLEDERVRRYAAAAAGEGTYEHLEDGSWFASVSGLEGAWGEGETEAQARLGLAQSVYSWALVRRDLNLHIPPVGTYEFKT